MRTIPPPRMIGPVEYYSSVISLSSTLFLFQYLLVSILFAMYTALLYITYHQSIIYLSYDRGKSYVDFLIAGMIGVFFGLSMIAPFLTLAFIGSMTTLILLYKLLLIDQYCGDIAGRMGLTKKRSGVEFETANRRERRRRVGHVKGTFRGLAREMMKSGGPTEGWAVIYTWSPRDHGRNGLRRVLW